jgi:YesN/AraC family two-component response regulator
MVVRRNNCEEIQCGWIESGEFFGEMAILGGGEFSLCVLCQEPLVCYVQKREDFAHMLDSHVSLRDFFYRTALTRLKEACRIVYEHKLGRIRSELMERNSSRKPRVIERALLHIEKNYTEPLTLDEVAQVNGMSKYHFSRVFKSQTGCSFKQHLNRVRIDAAKRLMSEEEMNVSEACYAVGYNDLSYFSRVFHKMEGETPSAYRKNVNPSLLAEDQGDR